MCIYENCFIQFETNRRDDDWGSGVGYGLWDENSRRSGDGSGCGARFEEYTTDIDLHGNGYGEPQWVEINDNLSDGTGLGF